MYCNYIIPFDSVQVVHVQTKELTEFHLARKETEALFEESIFCIMLLNGTLNQLLCQKKASHYTYTNYIRRKTLKKTKVL